MKILLFLMNYYAIHLYKSFWNKLFFFLFRYFRFFPHSENGTVHYLSTVIKGHNNQTHAFMSYPINNIDVSYYSDWVEYAN